MAIRNIREMGDEILNKKCKEVKEINERTRILIEDMIDTMYESNGVGLAAPQVGILKRIVVIDVSPEGEEPIILINPEIIEESEEDTTFSEGCLSLPGISENVIRPASITIRYMDENFTEHTETYDGFAARIIQHEYDHLEGHVFTDRISPIRRQFVKTKLTNIAKGKVVARYRTKQ